ncbi:hypothetical protein ACP70R_007586 [Stipagrostis hirtigluma subsp. patula]
MAMKSRVPDASMLPAALLLLFLVAVASVGAKLPLLEHAPKGDGSLAVLAVGDWGRRGRFNQTLVADQMGIIGEKMDIDFVISVGDNFYNHGLTGVHDKAFEESFTNIGGASILMLGIPQN